jgi:SAM-dependent methyltransferase
MGSRQHDWSGCFYFLERAAKWRGDPRASTRREFLRVLNYVSPSKRDVFYDLGCGYAGPCIWIAPRVRQAIGIENHYYRYLHARRDVAGSGSTNVKIVWDDIGRISFRDATILYSVIYVGFDIIKKIHRQTRRGSQTVLYGIPPYPLKSEKLFGEFYRLVTPFERVQDEDEFARLYLARKNATMKKLIATFDREQARNLRREIREADVNWNSLKKDS